MNKETLRLAINSVNPGDSLKVRLRSNPTREQTCTAVNKFIGRGKGGSLHLTLEGEDGVQFSIGTPKNDEVLGIALGHANFGVDDESKDLPESEPKPELAAQIKASMRSLLGEAGVGRKVEIESTFPALNGVFAIVEAKAGKGRFGQIHFDLISLDSDHSVSFRSYRNSGLLTSFQVIPESTEPAETSAELDDDGEEE